MTTDPESQPGGSEAGMPEATDMATLLAESEDYHLPQRGEIIEGTVMNWEREGALVDIGAKSEGIIVRHEMQSLGPDPESRLDSGDKVMVYVVQPETNDGQIVLSLDRARGEQGWITLQERFDSGETFEGEVSGYNKGGLLVNVEGVNAFVPMSQVVGVRPDRDRDDGGSSLAEAVGRTLRLKVIEINRRRNRVILSERAALQEWRLAQKERLIQELHEGDIRRGRVSSVRSFGVFVDLGGADGLAHLSELSWERDKLPSDLFNVGDEVDVYVTKIDAENKKIALSLRRANPEQWDTVVNKYKEEQVVTGLVTKLVTFGAFARIEGPVEGLIHVSELVDRRIGHPKEVVREGDLLPLKIVRIERDRHRLGLSLRRAREEGEGLGFVFTEGGEVLTVPDEIRQEFEAREGPIPEPKLYEEPAAPAPEAAPAASTEEPPATDAAPATEPDESPAASTVEPPATDEAPTAEPDEAPAASAEAPSATDEAPATGPDESPAASTEEPPATDEAPATGRDETPAASAEAPPATDEAPATAMDEAPVIEETPTPIAEGSAEDSTTGAEASASEPADDTPEATMPEEPVAEAATEQESETQPEAAEPPSSTDEQPVDETPAVEGEEKQAD